MKSANAEVPAYIARWRPSSVSPPAAAFAREVVAKTGPEARERAKNRLWAAGKLADYGLGLGLEPVPRVLLHPSAAERFTRCAPGMSEAARRTLRTNLRFIGRRVEPPLYPADLPLPRDRAKRRTRRPRSPASWRWRTPSPRRSGGCARRDWFAWGGRRADPRRPARRPRHRRGAPLRRRHRPGPRAAAARGAGAGPLPAPAAGRCRVRRRPPGLRRRRPRPPEHDEPPGGPLDGGGGLPRPGTSRLRATWLADCGQLLGLATFMPAAGISCSQRLGDLVACLERGRGAGGETARGGPAMIPLAASEAIIGASGAAPRIEAMLPRGPAPAVTARTLLLGMMLALAHGRPAHPTRVHRALARLPEDDQRRLGVLADWGNGPRLLTYRQAEYTFGLVRRARQGPAGRAAVTGTAARLRRPAGGQRPGAVQGRQRVAGRGLERPGVLLPGPRRAAPAGRADPEASWGHRKDNLTGDQDELFYGYYLSDAVMVLDEHGPPVPELARRMTASSCLRDPVPAFTPVLTAMPQDGIPLGDVLADSGYSHRVPGNWAVPLRLAGAALVQDLHPHDRGPRGTHEGAVIANGNLYCPAAPRALLELGPLSRAATPAQAAQHHASAAEAACYKLGRLTSDDADGYHRVQCPAAAGKVRCPLQPPSMTLDRDRPEILTPPRAAAGLLHPAVPHRPAARERENPAEARLPVGGLAPLLRPAQRGRARLRHRQGPRQQRHRPRLVPPHGPGPAHAFHRDAARRPQPAHPHRLEHPAGRKTSNAPPGASFRRPANAAARPSLPLPHRRNPPRPRARVPHCHHQDKNGGSMPAASREHTQSNQPDTQRS